MAQFDKSLTEALQKGVKTKTTVKVSLAVERGACDFGADCLGPSIDL
jgi:hypothetical protein